MKNALANKMSYFILTFIFLIITANFLFSGYDQFATVGSKNVATVDGTPVTIREFQIALKNQVDFYAQMFGKSLSEKEIEAMGIKRGVLSNLIQMKLVSNAAKEIGIVVSLDEIKDEIKNLKYFRRNEQFDVNLYRDMLAQNGYTPTQFEEMIGSDLKQKKMESFFASAIVSEKYIKDLLNFKSTGVNVHGVKIGRQALSPLISVTEDEIKAYVAKAENKKSLESLYQENISKYHKAEQIKARHILIRGEDEKALEKIKAIRSKTTAANFAATADKETEDPSGKKKGGDLGWFSRGMMVKEFDDVAFKLTKGQVSEPVKTQFGYHIIMLEDRKAEEKKTLEMVSEELARTLLQRTKSGDLDKLMVSELEKVKKLLEENKLAEIEELTKKTSSQFFKATDVNQFDQTIGQLTLSKEEAEKLFKASEGEILNFGNNGSIYLIKLNKKNAPAEEIAAEKITSEKAGQGQNLSRKLREGLMKDLNKNAKIVTHSSME